MPEFKIHNLWPIPVYENTLPVKQEWRDTFNNLKYSRTHIGNSDISDDKYVLEKMPDLKKLIEIELDNFIRKFLEVKDKVTFPMLNSWVNIHNPGDRAQEHYHGNSLISGVYYIDTAENCGGIVMCKSPQNTNLFHTSMRVEYNSANNIQAESYVIPVNEGKIVFFPSHLGHAVEQNNSDKPRVSLAFNFWIKGTLGVEEYKLDLK